VFLNHCWNILSAGTFLHFQFCTRALCCGIHIQYIQWNLDSSFSSGVWKRNDGYGKTIDAGAYIKLIKRIRFPCMYLLNQKTYTNNVIASTVKSTSHYFFLRKSLIFICLVAPFLFKLNNKLSVLTMFAWSLSNTRDKLRTKLNDSGKWNESH
jgi:hypothetical protein